MIEEELERRIASVESDLQKVRLDIDGDPFKDFAGLRQRVRNAEHDVKSLKEIIEALKMERAEERKENLRWRRLLLVLVFLVAAMACATLLVQFFYLLALPR